MKFFEGDQLISTKVVAKRFGVKPSTVRGWVSQDVIPFIKLRPGNGGTVRFDPETLNQWIKEKDSLLQGAS